MRTQSAGWGGWLGGWLAARACIGCLSSACRVLQLLALHGVPCAALLPALLSLSQPAIACLLPDTKSSPSSIFEHKPLPRGIRDPDSKFSLKWDYCQVVLLVYVSVLVPLRTCFSISNDDTASLSFWIDVLVDLFFIVDVVLNFRTAFW